MKYILFLQELHLSVDETRDLLKREAPEYEPLWNKEHAQQVCADVEVLVTAEHKVDATLMDEWPCLQMVSLAFTGYEQVKTNYVNSKGKPVEFYFVPDYATNSVAELNVLLAMSIMRRVPLADKSIRDGKWHDQVFPGSELAMKTVGIVGTGTIGTRTAERFRAFDCSIIGCSRTRRQRFIAIGGTYVSPMALFSKSDIVVLCLASNNETIGFVGETQLKWMKKDAILINTARSDLVDRKALVSALKDGRIWVGIDVFEHEPERGNDKLFSFDNVILTPHLGFKTTEALHRRDIITVENIGRFLRRENLNRLDRPSI